MKYNEIHIGDHAFGKGSHKVFLTDEARKEHCHIIGGTGTGKSKLMEFMIRQDIRNGKGLCLIDPHGNLFEAVLRWAVAHGFDHRLVVIDPNEREHSVGLNFLEYDPELFDVGQHVEDVIYEIGRARNEDIFATVQVVIWLRQFLQFAALLGLTFEEITPLLNENNQRLREKLTARIDSPRLKRKFTESWEQYDSAPRGTRSEFMKLPVWGRVQTFTATETMARIVGQPVSTVDFYEAMEKGRIVLVNLHGWLSENERGLLGAMIINKIYQAAQRRKPDRGKFFYVYIDEFGYFVSDRIAKSLEELRKRHVPFILAHQESEQLRDQSRDGQRLLASIMTNAKIKIAFRISREDAEDMAMEMFAGFITGDEIKFQQKVISFWPLKTREISRAYGHSISTGETNSVIDMFGQMASQLSGQVFVPGAGFLGVDQLATHSATTGWATSQGSGRSRSSMRGYTDSEATIEFPWYELIPFEQVVSTTFYSIEEIKERYIQFLQNQADRYFHLRIIGQTTTPPIALKTPTVSPVNLLPSLLNRAKLKSIQKYATPVSEIEQHCAERYQQLLALQGGEEQPDPELQYDQDDYEPRK